MSTEAVAVTGVLTVCWTAIIIGDAVISGILSAICSITFKKAFLRGLILLLIPPVFIVWGALIGRERPQVKEVELEFNNLPYATLKFKSFAVSKITCCNH